MYLLPKARAIPANSRWLVEWVWTIPSALLKAGKRPFSPLSTICYQHRTKVSIRKHTGCPCVTRVLRSFCCSFYSQTETPRKHLDIREKGGQAGERREKRMTVDEGRDRRNPGCIAYMIHLFKAREPNNGVEKIPSHPRGLCMLLRGIRLGAAGTSICHPQADLKKEIWPDPTGQRRQLKLVPISCLLDSGSGQISYLSRKKQSYIKTREEK